MYSIFSNSVASVLTSMYTFVWFPVFLSIFLACFICISLCVCMLCLLCTYDSTASLYIIFVCIYACACSSMYVLVCANLFQRRMLSLRHYRMLWSEGRGSQANDFCHLTISQLLRLGKVEIKLKRKKRCWRRQLVEWRGNDPWIH